MGSPRQSTVGIKDRLKNAGSKTLVGGTAALAAGAVSSATAAVFTAVGGGISGDQGRTLGNDVAHAVPGPAGVSAVFVLAVLWDNYDAIITQGEKMTLRLKQAAKKGLELTTSNPLFILGAQAAGMLASACMFPDTARNLSELTKDDAYGALVVGGGLTVLNLFYNRKAIKDGIINCGSSIKEWKNKRTAAHQEALLGDAVSDEYSDLGASGNGSRPPAGPKRNEETELGTATTAADADAGSDTQKNSSRGPGV